MRRLLILVLALAPLPAAAEIRSADACAAAVAADPAAAREEAALWARTGGGVPARLCEAEALAALGAHATAALILTRLAENPNRAMAADLQGRRPRRRRGPVARRRPPRPRRRGDRPRPTASPRRTTTG